ncbi:hypothetical protein K491DRAFT_77386 [Lophiostoma macrostomum CBS 122681]|uniref:Nephrocystin 3-like N-terminal domain-containing protein n=1 Tax=Lophiostoma macrostomum CBS 122681 TaxID=1314788 RepID=A0A6A6TLT8_9PLEO|nr:hypothetical protein K491DRAFT_77386 [Lophiostoma macrostomum CBS 122681]
MRNKLQDDLKRDAGNWLLQRTEYRHWENEGGASGLRIEGEVGTGKSILTSTVFEHISAKYSTAGEIGIPTAVFYCSGVRDSYGSPATDGTESGASGANDILRSILRQFGQSTEGFQLLAEEYKSRPQNRKELQLSDTKRLLRQLVEMHKRSFIVLDALDECLTTGQDTKRLNIMELFQELLSTDVSVKIFVSSRFESDIQERLKAWSTVPVIPAVTKNDLDIFVDRTIDRELQDKEDCDENDKNELKEKLKVKASRNFRWAQVSLDYICEPNRSGFDLLSVLESIPSELNDFYFNLLCEVKNDHSPLNRILGMRALQLLVATTRLKNRQTTRHFLIAVRANTSYENRPIEIRHIRAACHHLVTWDKISESFAFGHFSVAEFFNADSSTNRHSQAIRSDFDTGALWPLVSESAITLLAEYTSASKLYWAQFNSNLKESLCNPCVDVHLKVQSNTEHHTRVAVLGAGVDVHYGDFDSDTLEGVSFSSVLRYGKLLVEEWYLGEGLTNFGGIQIAATLRQVEPDCDISIVKFCSVLGSQDSPPPNIENALLWACQREVDIILVSTPLYTSAMTDQIRATLEKVAKKDIIIIYNVLDYNDKDNSTTGPAVETRKPETYFFHGDKSLQGVLPYTRYSAQTAVAIIGSAIASGIAAFALQNYYQDATNGPPKSKRQFVKEWFDKLADEGTTGNAKKMPWSLVKGTAGGDGRSEPRLQAMLY